MPRKRVLIVYTSVKKVNEVIAFNGLSKIDYNMGYNLYNLCVCFYIFLCLFITWTGGLLLWTCRYSNMIIGISALSECPQNLALCRRFEIYHLAFFQVLIFFHIVKFYLQWVWFWLGCLFRVKLSYISSVPTKPLSSFSKLKKKERTKNLWKKTIFQKISKDICCKQLVVSLKDGRFFFPYYKIQK